MLNEGHLGFIVEDEEESPVSSKDIDIKSIGVTIDESPRTPQLFNDEI